MYTVYCYWATGIITSHSPGVYCLKEGRKKIPGFQKWSPTLLRDPPARIAPPSGSTSGTQCTLSECLFFFGIYSFHLGGPRKTPGCLPIFGGGNAIHFLCHKFCVKLALRACLSPTRKIASHLPCFGLPPALKVPTYAVPAQDLLRTAILPGIHLNPSDFRS